MRLKITRFGQSAEGIQLTGNPKSCEPDHVRIAFPGGDIEVVRATDGEKPDYWVHIRVNKEGRGMFTPGEDMAASIVDGRLDILGMHAADANIGDFDNKGLYHVAVRVKPQWEAA